MSRHILTAFLALLLAGCQPADPLDWKVSAKTPAHYDEWRDEKFPKLPPALQAEFGQAFNFISSMTPLARTVDENAWDKTGNPLCRRLDGRTIRRVLLDGYDLEKRSLYARISTESEQILTNVKRAEKADDAETWRRFEQVRAAQNARIAEMNQRVSAIDRRIKELSGP